jgi:hypothetical protein
VDFFACVNKEQIGFQKRCIRNFLTEKLYTCLSQLLSFRACLSCFPVIMERCCNVDGFHSVSRSLSKQTLKVHLSCYIFVLNFIYHFYVSSYYTYLKLFSTIVFTSLSASPRVHGDDYGECRRLGCYAMWLFYEPTFRRKV